MTKICTKCKVEKSLEEFSTASGRRSGRRADCKECSSKYARQRRALRLPEQKERDYEVTKAWAAANPEKVWYHGRLQKLKSHGLTFESFYLLSKLQRDCCAICNQKTKLHIDHCHSTGKVRGLLCPNCNTALGLLKDSQQTLKSAIEYLENGGVLE